MGTYNNIHTPTDDFYYYCPDDDCPCHGTGNDHDRAGNDNNDRAGNDDDLGPDDNVYTPNCCPNDCYICANEDDDHNDDNPSVADFRAGFLEFAGIDLFDPYDRPADIDDALAEYIARRRHPAARERRTRV